MNKKNAILITVIATGTAAAISGVIGYYAPRGWSKIKARRTGKTTIGQGEKIRAGLSDLGEKVTDLLDQPDVSEVKVRKVNKPASGPVTNAEPKRPRMPDKDLIEKVTKAGEIRQ